MSEHTDPGAADFETAGCGHTEPEQIVEMADDLAAGALGVDAEAHVAECAACRTAIRAQREVSALVGDFDRQPAPTALLEGVQAGMRKPVLPLRRLLFPAAAAAAILLAVGTLVYLEARGPHPTRSSQQVAAAAGETASAERATEPRSSGDAVTPVETPRPESREAIRGITPAPAPPQGRDPSAEPTAAPGPAPGDPGAPEPTRAPETAPQPGAAPQPEAGTTVADAGAAAIAGAAPEAPVPGAQPAAPTPDGERAAAPGGVASDPDTRIVRDTGEGLDEDGARAAADAARVPRQAAAPAPEEDAPEQLSPSAAGTLQSGLRVRIRAVDPDAARPRVEALLTQHGALVFRMVEPGGAGGGPAPVVAHVPRTSVRSLLAAIQEAEGLRLPGATYPPPPGDGAHVLLLIEVIADPLGDGE